MLDQLHDFSLILNRNTLNKFLSQVISEKLKISSGKYKLNRK